MHPSMGPALQRSWEPYELINSSIWPWPSLSLTFTYAVARQHTADGYGNCSQPRPRDYHLALGILLQPPQIRNIGVPCSYLPGCWWFNKRLLGPIPNTMVAPDSISHGHLIPPYSWTRIHHGRSTPPYISWLTGASSAISSTPNLKTESTLVPFSWEFFNINIMMPLPQTPGS